MGMPQRKIDSYTTPQNLGHANEKQAGRQTIANQIAASKAKGRMFGNDEHQKFTKNYENLQYIYNPKEILQESQMSEEERQKQQEQEEKYQANKREHEQMIAQRKASQAGWFNSSGKPAANNNQTAFRPANDNLNPQQQGQAQADMEAYKQRALGQIAKKKSKLEQELAELEKDLTDFKNGQALRILGIFHPGIEGLIDTIINEIRKRAKKMSKARRIKFLEKMIPKFEMLLTMLKGLKAVAAFLDATFFDKASCARLVIFTFATIIIPIILLLVSPLYILFLTVLIYVNKVPLMKGILTKQVEYITVKVKNRKESWEKELKKLTRDVALKKQIAKLEQAAQQIQSGQISYKGRGAN